MASYAPKYPRGLERKYRLELKLRADLLYRVTMRILRSFVLKADSEEWRDDAILLAWLKRALDAAKALFNGQFAPDAEEVRQTGSQVERHARHQAERSVAAAKRGQAHRPRLNIPYREGPILDAWVNENVKLIRSIDSRWFDDVEKVITEGAREGRALADISRDLQERYGVSKSRADLIGRDQMAKLNGQVVAKRSQSLGVRRYRWSTSKDERVRTSHEKREGKEYSWSDSPIPGQEIQCRCVAISIFDDEEF